MLDTSDGHHQYYQAVWVLYCIGLTIASDLFIIFIFIYLFIYLYLFIFYFLYLFIFCKSVWNTSKTDAKINDIPNATMINIQ